MRSPTGPEVSLLDHWRQAISWFKRLAVQLAFDTAHVIGAPFSCSLFRSAQAPFGWHTVWPLFAPLESSRSDVAAPPQEQHLGRLPVHVLSIPDKCNVLSGGREPPSRCTWLLLAPSLCCSRWTVTNPWTLHTTELTLLDAFASFCRNVYSSSSR